MKSFIKNLSFALLSTIFSLFIYDQYINIPQEKLIEKQQNPNLIPEAVRILLLGPGVAYIIKLYIANAKMKPEETRD